MARGKSSQRQKQISELLKNLRKQIAKTPPVYFVRFDGLPDGVNSGDVLSILMSGVCEQTDVFFSYNTSDGFSPVIFGFAANWEAGLDGLGDVAQGICDFVLSLMAEAKKGRVETVKDRDKRKLAVLAASMIQILIESVRRNEPESLSLPDNILASPFIASNPPARLLFPTGKVVYLDAVRQPLRSTIVDAISAKKISITLLKTPVIQTAALIFHHMGEQEKSAKGKREMRRVGERLQTQMERRNRCRLTLRGPDDNPLIDGQQQPILNPREYKVVKSIMDAKAAGQSRLTEPELDRKTGITQARKVFKALSGRNALWKAILQFPERKGHGYGIE